MKRYAYYIAIRKLAPMMARKGWRYSKHYGAWVPR